MTKTPRVRFAPSPTGYLHVGNVRTALVNWLFARQMGGTFILRIDDTDLERSRVEYETAIAEDLRWLGIQWDESFKQSDRMDRYAEAKQQLIDSGRLYACYETAEELEIRRKMQVSRGAPPIYDRAALKLSDEQKKAYAAEGRRPHWRFLLNDQDIVWEDMVRGAVRFEGRHMSDPVLLREDGLPLYTLSSVVDDGDSAITHVVRGEDHVSNTAVQVQIFEALGFAVPTFAHLALLKLKEGELSKRIGSGGVRDLREQGIFPLAINSYLAKMGTSDAVELAPSMDALAESFAFAKFGRSVATFDDEELSRLNARLLHGLPFADVQGWLSGHGVQINEKFWQQIRGNTMSLSQVKTWKEAILDYHPQEPHEEDSHFLQISAGLLPEEPWDERTFKRWSDSIKAETGRSGKNLFMPLRRALTGMEHGPELDKLLLILGREDVLLRLIRVTVTDYH
ncbi:MAG: glutamate--tRNA ligase [Rickettsiales bacterium]|nr:glutamate--tRNA ligase [Rickettsiales bacterium]